MGLKVALQMEPIGSVNIKGDSTFRIALAAQARGHPPYFYTPNHLSFVEGTVVDTYKSAKVIFLNFSPNREACKLVIVAGDWKLWPELPDVVYRGKTLQVTGEVKLYKGAPEMILNGPEQVVVK